MSYQPSPHAPEGDNNSDYVQNGNPSASEPHQSPFPTASNHIVPPPAQNHPHGWDQRGYAPSVGQQYGYAVPQSTGSTAPENYYHGGPVGNTLAWTSIAAIISTGFNILMSLIPILNIFIVPITGLVGLIFTIIAFVAISDGKNDKKGLAIASAVLLLASVFTFFLSYFLISLGSW